MAIIFEWLVIGMDTDALLQIWRLASGGKSQEKLNKDCWFVAMKLVALVQSTGKCQLQSLYAGEPLPLADFQFDCPPDNVVRMTVSQVVVHS